jgi:hypothetical protein
MSIPLFGDGDAIDLALNEITTLGWTLVTVAPMVSPQGLHYFRAFFKKEP